VGSLYRIRWQEAWGDHLTGVIGAGYVDSDVDDQISDLAADWFANGDPVVTRDEASPTTWRISDRTTGRTVYLFVEQIG